jgi:hypothetical protein
MSLLTKFPEHVSSPRGFPHRFLLEIPGFNFLTLLWPAVITVVYQHRIQAEGLAISLDPPKFSLYLLSSPLRLR